MKKLLLIPLSLAMIIIGLPLFAAFEAHVVNVSATIENALFVHPESLEFGTVFPQEHLDSSFFLAFSQSFSARDQRRVGTVEYVIKQKPQCVDAQGNFPRVGEDASGNFICPSGSTMRPTICPYLSKTPDNNPSTGPNANNDIGLPPFHDPATQFASGKIVKFNTAGSIVGNDPADTWTVDLAVPCFKGQCAQDWASFVHGLNPNVGDPMQYQLPAGLEHQTFGCDLWVEVTSIH